MLFVKFPPWGGAKRKMAVCAGHAFLLLSPHAALSLCYPLHCCWCWRALPAAIITLVKSLHCADDHPFRIWDERERLVTASPVMTKSRAPDGGNNYPEGGLVKPPRRDTRALSPAGMSGGKAPVRLAAQKSKLHAPSVPVRSAPAYFHCKWGV
jgi:hypothetical protein